MNENWGVHRTHCCVIDGCKYGDDDCPVVLGLVKQDWLCQDCSDTYNSDIELCWSKIDKKILKLKIELRKKKLKRILK